MKKEA